MESCRELKENNPYLFNSWRAILYTEKGRKAGVVNDWRKFPVFYERDWFVKNILKSQCIYCGSKEKLGCDRIDNSKGHTYDNVVPCCYVCNCARNNNFSFDEMKILGKTIKKIMEDRLSGNGN